MKEFQFLDYCTIYSCEGDLHKEYGESACFGYVFDAIRANMTVDYVITIHKGVDFARTAHKSNACLLDVKKATKHINLLKSIYPIDIKVEDSEDTFNVYLSLSNVPPSFHKYALTWVRYLYEFPYNVLLRDAYELKKNSCFRFESIANLFNLCMGCSCINPREIHQVPLNVVSTRLSVNELRERIKKVNRLNSIYKKLSRKEDSIPDNIGEYSCTDSEYWDEGYKERETVYLRVYNKNK